ncbi:DUF7117 family protein [Halomarina litorea]|uniref:DUF7117 family protein n=1 Tax=Halomarina litorea TaxID=2961595 RepID=UPI0020C425C4|nr:TFIIB-type zinc ribbon-containing protein [Halomarina sp. BCD28]
MKVRGQRECTDCGTQWSYYETGTVECPNCGSLRSRGVDERTEHTDTPVTFDLTPARNRVDDGLLDAAEEAAELCREFVRKTGFVHAGDLKPLSDTYLAAAELAAVTSSLRRAMRTTDEEELYLLDLLRGADHGERPDPESVPESLHAARGLAYAAAVDDYRDDVRTYLGEHPDSAASAALQTVANHVRQIEALDGEVDVRTTERVVRATQDVGRYLVEGDEGALAAARERLAELE